MWNWYTINGGYVRCVLNQTFSTSRSLMKMWWRSISEKQTLFSIVPFMLGFVYSTSLSCSCLSFIMTLSNPLMEIRLVSKMYSLLYDGKEKKIAKWVKKSVVNKHLKHESYKQALFDHCSARHWMNMIESFNHQLYSVSIHKTTLSSFDDKCYVLDSGIHTLAHGHNQIKM